MHWHQEMEKIQSTRSHGSAVVRDEEPGEALDVSRRANAVFITQGMLLGAVSLIDLVSATALQIFWGDLDFLCMQRTGWPQGDTCNVFDGYRANHVTLIAFIIGAYTFLLFFGVWDVTSKGMSMIRGTEQQRWWDKAWRALIALVLAASLIVLVLHVQLCDINQQAFITENLWRTNVLRRVHTVLHFMRCFCIIATCIGLQQELKARLQSSVSRNKRRFQDGSFDLDLTYICDRLVAMGIPCVSGVPYRNDVRDVARFFSTRHYGRFIVFNLCEDHEEAFNGNYDSSYFFGQVCRIPFPDHNSVALHKLIGFLRDATAFLDLNPEHVVAVHCQGGKGRTGMLCASLLLWSGFTRSVADAINYFGSRRTDPARKGKEFQTVAAPSQKRYITYVDQIINGFDFMQAPTLILQRITIKTMPMPYKEKYFVACIVESGMLIEYDSGKAKGTVMFQRCNPEKDEFVIDVGHVKCRRDMVIRFYYFNEDPSAM